MTGPLADLKSLFCSDALRDALNARLTLAGLPSLAPVPIARHRRQLRSAARYPALAVELGAVTGRLEGAGGLASLRGTATYWLAVGAPGDNVLLERLAAALEVLRDTLATELAGKLTGLRFASAGLEGEVWQEGAVALRLAPLRFDFIWLYEPTTAQSGDN